jgi:hypothetical protein
MGSKLEEAIRNALKPGAEDAYALHCCWEFQQEDDPRAPETRSVEAGREILARYNAL